MYMALNFFCRESRGLNEGEMFRAVCLCKTCSYVFWKVSTAIHVFSLHLSMLSTYNSIIHVFTMCRITATLVVEDSKKKKKKKMRMTHLQLLVRLPLTRNKDSRLNSSSDSLSTNPTTWNFLCCCTASTF